MKRVKKMSSKWTREITKIAKAVHKDFVLDTRPGPHMRWILKGPAGKTLTVVSRTSSDRRETLNAKAHFIRACAVSGLRPNLG